MILILLTRDRFGDANVKKLNASKDIVNAILEIRNVVHIANALIAKIKNKNHN